MEVWRHVFQQSAVSSRLIGKILSASAAILVFSFLFSGQAAAQGVTGVSASSDPAVGRAYVHVNGVTHIVDRATDSVIVRGANGQEFIIPFEQVAAQVAYTLAITEAEALAELREGLSDMDAIWAQTDSYHPRPARHDQPPPGGGGGDIPVQPHSIGISSSGEGNDDTEEGPCEEGPCTPQKGEDDRIFYMQDRHSGGVGQRPVTQQELWNYDLRQWQRARDGACEEMRDNMALASLASTVAARSCPGAMTPAGAIGCAGGGGDLYIPKSARCKTGKAVHGHVSGFQ